jgi:hypothetical protein
MTLAENGNQKYFTESKINLISYLELRIISEPQLYRNFFKYVFCLLIYLLFI